VHDIIQQIKHLLDPEFLIGLGYIVMTIVVFTETGLLIGFCLPGDSLLVTAGYFAYQGNLSFWLLNALLIPAAIVGDSVGYWIGLKSGPHLFKREKSLLFNPEHLRRANEFYERHGGKTIVLARFMPIIRTFAPLVAGIGRMRYRDFLYYNVFGGIGWVLSMTTLGYLFGSIVPAKKLEYIIIAVIVISIAPMGIPIVKGWLAKRRSAKLAETPENPAEAEEDPAVEKVSVESVE
jgi:membrane-associated protein